MDFRMEKSSWFMIIFMIATMMYYVMAGAGGGLGFSGYMQVFFIALICTIALIALACIPVIVYCYFVKKIPDIDYSIILATAMTVIGIISEIIF